MHKITLDKGIPQSQVAVLAVVHTIANVFVSTVRERLGVPFK